MQLNLSIAEIRRIIGAVNASDDSFFVKNISSLEKATPDDLVVVMDKGEFDVFAAVSPEKINASNAGIFLAKEEIVPGKKYLLVQDPLNAFQKLVAHVEQKDSSKNPLIHASAVIEEGAVVGENSSVGALSFIGNDVQIGKNVKIYPGVKILDRCLIGDNSIIHSGTVIGSDGFSYKATKFGIQKIPQIGIVKIGNDVEIGANCCIDRAAFDETVIGNGVKIDNFVHIAHNVKIGDFTIIIAQTGIAGSVQIGSMCMIGGQVGIRDHVKIGNGVKIVSKSGVMNDLKDGQTVAGNPATDFIQWKKTAVITAKLPEVFKDFSKIKAYLDSKSKKGFIRKFLGL